MSDERQVIRLSLAPDSLPQLLAGPLCTRFYLWQDPADPADVYRMNANVATNETTQSLLRAVTELAPDERPLPEPSAFVADQESRWRLLFELLPTAETMPEDQKVSFEQICRAFRVPPWLMSNTPKPPRFSRARLRWWWWTR